MTRILIFIKHNLPFIWSVADWLNSKIFEILYFSQVNCECEKVLTSIQFPDYQFRKLNEEDLVKLSQLINKQKANRLNYFKPHGFDWPQLKRIHDLKSFIMMGAFNDDKIVGYFFLRCFANRQCFVGRFIDESYEGKGIGRIMNDIMYNIGWNSGFHVMSTISKNNHWVMRSHANNKTMRVVKKLDNDFMLVEFLKPIN